MSPVFLTIAAVTGTLESGSLPSGTLSSGELLAAIAERLRTRGEQPWLFFRRGWDWRWWSFRETWQRAVTIAAGPDAASSANRGDADPGFGSEGALVADLASWVSADGTLREPALAWTVGGARSAVTVAELVRLGRELERELVATQRPPPRAWRVLGLPRGLRVAVDTAKLDRPADRVGWAWSLLTGASLALVGDEDEWLEAVMWVRPTDLWGDGSRIDRLAAASGQRRGRRSLVRLGGFALVAGTPPASESGGALSGLGIQVVRHPLS